MECAEPELEWTARRARRAARTWRLVFYLGAVLVAVLLLAGRSDGDDSTTFKGRTDQGHAFELRIVDERPAFLSTRIAAACPSREPWVVDWSKSAAVPFSGDGRRLTIVEGGAHSYEDGLVGSRQVNLEAQIDGDRMTGSMSLSELLGDRSWERTYRCESGPVRFSAESER